MNCDQAFDVMTHPRRPEPLSAAAIELKQHLQFCPRCRQMQEVLAPALDSLHDSPSPFEKDEFTGPSESFLPATEYQSKPISMRAEEVIRIADEAARRLQSPSPAKGPHILPKQRSRAFPVVTMIALFACAMMGGRIAVGLLNGGNGQNSGVTPVINNNDDCLWLAKKDDSPRKNVAFSMTALSAEQLIQSCLKCHEQLPRELDTEPLPGAPREKAESSELFELDHGTVSEGLSDLCDQPVPDRFVLETISPEIGPLAIWHQGEQGRSPRGLAYAGNLFTL